MIGLFCAVIVRDAADALDVGGSLLQEVNIDTSSGMWWLKVKWAY